MQMALRWRGSKAARISPARWQIFSSQNDGLWRNVKTLLQNVRLAQTFREMNNYSVVMMEIAEAKWTGAEKQTLNSGETIIGSERQDNKHKEWVVIVIASKYANTLLQLKPTSERLQYVRWNARNVEISIIVAYSSFENADE